MKILQIIRLISVCAGAWPLGGQAQQFFTESFEQGSVFGPASGYSRSPLTGVGSAPNTAPALHINQGGDLEFLYTEASTTHVVAFAPGIYTDAIIDGYVGIGSGGSSGGISGGLVLRATGPSDFYLAFINTNPSDPRSGTMFLAESTGGVIHGFFSSIDIPNFDPLHEDYHITFGASGSLLTASLSRERVAGGVVLETFLGSVSAVDDSLVAGQTGLYSFARNPHNVFFDDIAVTPVPEPKTTVLFSVGLIFFAGLTYGRRLFYRPGKSRSQD